MARKGRPTATAGVTLTVEDLRKFRPNIDEAKAEEMITDAIALAALVAPCLDELTGRKAQAAKAIIRAAVLRWDEQGNGEATSVQADVFGLRFDTSRARTAGGFLRTELDQLRLLCHATGGAYTIDMVPDEEHYTEPPWMEFVDP